MKKDRSNCHDKPKNGLQRTLVFPARDDSPASDTPPTHNLGRGTVSSGMKTYLVTITIPAALGERCERPYITVPVAQEGIIIGRASDKNEESMIVVGRKICLPSSLHTLSCSHALIWISNETLRIQNLSGEPAGIVINGVSIHEAALERGCIIMLGDVKCEVDINDREESLRDRIVDALKKSGGNHAKAASLLGMGRTSLYKNIKKLSILEEEYDPQLREKLR